MSTLNELVSQAAQIEELLINSNGEITPELEAMILNVDFNLPQKLDNYSLLIERMKMVSEFYKSRAEKLLLIAKSCGEVEKRCKENLKNAMQTLGVDELKGVDIRFKLQKAKDKLILDETVPVEDRFLRVEYVVDKTKITEALKQGEDVKGAHFEPSYYVREYQIKP